MALTQQGIDRRIEAGAAICASSRAGLRRIPRYAVKFSGISEAYAMRRSLIDGGPV
jgi:hypothetical protein